MNVVVHTCSPSTQETENKRIIMKATSPTLEIKATLGGRRPCLKETNSFKSQHVFIGSLKVNAFQQNVFHTLVF